MREQDHISLEESVCNVKRQICEVKTSIENIKVMIIRHAGKRDEYDLAGDILERNNESAYLTSLYRIKQELNERLEENEKYLEMLIKKGEE